MNLEKILESVAQGRIDINAAKSNIKKIFESRKTQIDGLLKKSSDVVQHLTENVPNRIEKLSNNLSQNFHSVAFSPHIPGMDAKLSIFRGTEVSNDCIVSDNQVLGSQCFGVRFSDTSEFNQNKITAVQLTEISSARSNFSHNNINLSRLHNFSLQEARFEDCRLTRSTLNEVSIAESDFISNKLMKSELSRTIINESRLSGLTLHMTSLRDCEFTGCDMQGIEFEECELSECVFTNVNVKSRIPLRITHKNLRGVSIHDCKSLEEFLKAIDEGSANLPKQEATKTDVSEPQKASVSRRGAESKAAAVENAEPQRRPAPKKQPAQTSSAKSPRKKASIPLQPKA